MALLGHTAVIALLPTTEWLKVREGQQWSQQAGWTQEFMTFPTKLLEALKGG